MKKKKKKKNSREREREKKIKEFFSHYKIFIWNLEMMENENLSKSFFWRSYQLNIS